MTKHPTLLAAFQHWERSQPDAVYLTQPYSDEQVVDYSWFEVGRQARSMAAYLKSLDLPPKSHIALLGLNSAHWIMADLAIWMAGHITVPLYPTVNARTMEYILQHSESKLLLLGKMDAQSSTWKEIEKGIPQALPIIGLPMCPRPDVENWDRLVAQHAPLVDIAQPKPDELATIIYTSGSTGNPKGVMLSHHAMALAAQTIGEVHQLTPQDRMLSYLPLAHAAERAIIESTSLSFGCRVYFNRDLSTFIADLKRARPTFFFSVPRLWTKFYLGIVEKLPEKKQKRLFKVPVMSRLVKRKILSELGLDHVRVAITGSAPLPPHIVEWYRSLGLELLDCYGMSENFGISHASRPGAVRIGYVGSPQPGVEHRIANNGELQVKCVTQMLGYYKEPELTAESYTEDGYFKTGDRGEIDEQNLLRITGRVKELFKTAKGKYVAPAPIENKLGQHPKVECVCLTGPSQPQPFALVMLSPEAQGELANGGSREGLSKEFTALLEQVNHTLEEHERLAYLVVVKDQWTMENGFLTPTMKLKRNVIEERYLPQAEHWLEHKQAVVWE